MTLKTLADMATRNFNITRETAQRALEGYKAEREESLGQAIDPSDLGDHAGYIYAAFAAGIESGDVRDE